MTDNRENAASNQQNDSDFQLPAMTVTVPDTFVDVVADGDVVLVVSSLAGLPTPFGLRVSGQAMALSSAVFQSLLAQSDLACSPSRPKLISLDDDGDALLLLLYVLHLRNDALPARIQPDMLFRFCTVVSKYNCFVAASRCASQWFDHLYNKVPDLPLLPMIEATYLLDDAFFFARFTSRWVLTEPVASLSMDIPADCAPGRKKLLADLRARQHEGLWAIRTDIDKLVDPCAEVLSNDAEHFIDVAPGDEMHPDEVAEGRKNVHCVVDREGATQYLGALRDANIWPPATTWRAATIGLLIEKFKRFQVPDYDATDSCLFCLEIQNTFPAAVKVAQEKHEARLWGLCLDCFKVDGIHDEDCRYDHEKPSNTLPLPGSLILQPPDGGLPEAYLRAEVAKLQSET